MKIFIQIFLIVATLLVLARMLAVRKTHRGGAWKKIGFIILSVLVVVSVLNPDSTTILANLVGIGRGADLLLYVLFTAFLFYVVSQYIKEQDSRDTLYRLARRVALIEAGQKYDERLNRK